MSIFFNILCILVLIDDFQVFASNYCSAGNSTSVCPRKVLDAHIVDMKPFQDPILKPINVLRNQVATCDLEGFAPACRMPTVQWSNDLARHAETNLKYCSNTPDGCRDMETSRRMTQLVNSFVIDNLNYIPTFYQFRLDGIIHHWYSLNRYANQMKMARFQKSSPDYGPFAILVNQRVDRIGCAATAIHRKYRHIDLITICIFPTRNMPGKAVYEEGKSGTGCTTGPNPNYPGLCSINERVNPHEN